MLAGVVRTLVDWIPKHWKIMCITMVVFVLERFRRYIDFHRKTSMPLLEDERVDVVDKDQLLNGEENSCSGIDSEDGSINQ